MTGYTPIYNLPYPEPSDLVSAYPGTGQDLAEEVETVLAAKVAYALPKNAQTGTTYTFVLADANKLVTASNAASSTYTIPPQSSVTWTADTVIRVVNYGAGVVTFAGGSGVTVTNTAATLAQYQSAALVRTASDAWTVVPFSGGGKATVTGTTGSPTIDTTSRPGKTIYKFLTVGSSQSITIGASGYVEALVVGGGGGSGTVSQGLNGSPGWIITGYQYLNAGTYTITVGAGGTAGTTAKGGDSSIGTLAQASGGGYSTSTQTALTVASSITGSSVNYGGFATSSGSPANTGAAGGSPSGGHNGCSGIVVIVTG